MNKPIIFHLITGLDVGGTEMALARLLPATTDAFSHHICSILPAGPMAEKFKDRGIVVHSLNLRHVADGAAFLRLKRLLTALTPAVVSTYLIHADLLGRVVSRLAHVPVVVSNQRGSLLQWQWLGPFEYATAGLVDAYTVQTHAAEQRLRRRHRTKRIQLLPNGVGVPRQTGTKAAARAELGLDSRTQYVTCVSQLRRGKGHLVLLEAWRTIAPRFPHASVLLVGDGEMRQALERCSSQNQLRVTLLGERRDVATILAASDLFVLPTEAEGMSNALLEAMAAGLPCIASDIPANAEVIEDAINGLLFRSKNAQSLADALHDLLGDPKRAQNVGTAARATIEERFTLEAAATRYISFINSLLR
jgi:glycosyltransferase involved in cell wall biosynthesis